jgi:hypothetical protein
VTRRTVECNSKTRFDPLSALNRIALSKSAMHSF